MDAPADPCPSKKIRTFIALNTPPEWEVETARIQNSLKKAAPGADIKWVEPKNIHLTLRFLGYIQPSEVGPISDGLKQVASGINHFAVVSRDVGCFPHCRNPRVIWIGLNDPDAVLGNLQKAVVQATRDFGEPPEERPFKAHLTLARVKHLSNENARLLQAQIEKTELKLPPWRVTELLFLQSHLSPAGARYEALGRFEFL
jgi:RNA 2',3'-cyclic 3'-phosphodiesterase